MQAAAAEQERSDRLSEVEKERRNLAVKIQEAEDEMKSIRLELDPLNEQKAKLVAQLKQVRHSYSHRWKPFTNFLWPGNEQLTGKNTV